MRLESVASEAGYTRGALYYLFENKIELTTAAIEWAHQHWYDEVGFILARNGDPVATLTEAARATAVYCRSDRPKILSRLTTEFDGADHPIRQAIEEIAGHVLDDTARLITLGQRSGDIRPGTPPHAMALAYIGAITGVVNNLRGEPRYDALLAEGAALGVLGLPPVD